MKDSKIPEIFLSYSWSKKTKEKADIIDSDFAQIGLRIIRDIREINYKDNLNVFMSRIRETDYAILMISDEYLRSKNCMFEALELLKEIDNEAKILPVLINEPKESKPDIFSVEGKLGYINYWKEEKKRIEDLMENVESIRAMSILEELKIVDQIYSGIDNFLGLISGMLNFSFAELKEKGYKPILDHIGFNDITYLLELLVATQIKDVESKEIALDDYFEKYPPNTFGYFYRGITASQKGHHRKAIHNYRKSIKLDPNNSEALNNLGFLLEYTVRTEEAIDEAKTLYERAVEERPDFVVAKLNLGVILNRLEKKEEAKKQFEEILEIDSEDERAHANLANYYKLKGGSENIKKAEFHYKESLRINPNFLDALIGYANFLKSVKKEIDHGNMYYQIAQDVDTEGKYTELITQMLNSSKG